MPDQEKSTEFLEVSKLCSGDKNSLIIAGMVVAHSIEKFGIAVLEAKDGIVTLVNPNRVTLDKSTGDEFLNSLSEEEAITLLTNNNWSEQDIIEYLDRRSKKVK